MRSTANDPAAHGQPRSPLAGLRVVDLSTVVFGPYCTQTLADLGADVIKIEPPEGDTVRVIGTPAHTPGMGPVFLRLNRGKRSVVWDMKSEPGRTAIQRLLATADILVHNIRPEAVDRLGLGYDAVRALTKSHTSAHRVRPDPASATSGSRHLRTFVPIRRARIARQTCGAHR